MVRLQLSIKAELEGVTDLQPADPGSFNWFFTVKCNSCNEVHPNHVSLARNEERELTHGKGSTANFVWRCGGCKRESSAKFEPTSAHSLAFTEESSTKGVFTPLLVLDCRGLEFIGFTPQGVWKCIGVESGIVFDDVELIEGEWNDYDEKAKIPVGIANFEHEWSRAP